MAGNYQHHFTVVGAGIVGVCCAAFLQRQGFSVTLIDQDAPGRGCTFGNAGNFSIGTVTPNATPGIVWRVPHMLMDPLHPLHISLRSLPTAVPFFRQFLRNSRLRKVHEIASALHSLLSRVFESYETLLGPARMLDIIRQNGKLYTYESEAAFAGDAFRYAVQDRFGVRREVLDGNAARELEPALTTSVRVAVFWPDYGWTVNPHRLTMTIFEDFVRQGGTFLKTRVLGIQTNGSRANAVVTAHEAIPVDQIVIAAGARSKRFAADLGNRVCLEPERGYHLSLPDAGISLNRTVMSFERFISATPMEDGLRISGVSEFAGLDAPPRMELTQQVAYHAREMFPGISLDGASRWMGERPSTPDSLPIIGRASSNPNAYFAFGHFGLTLGAITGRVIAELATGRPTTVDLAPFRPDRF